MKSLNVVQYAVSLVLSMSPALGPAWAEDPSIDEMVCALDPQCAMPFADRRLRGITASPAIRPPASFDITLNFPYNSAELTPDSRAKLDRVAKALTDPSTIKLEIIVSGHTDARGSADYNQVLSERRAEAVRQFLISERGIDPKRLVAKGYGKSKLLLPSDPNNDLNRRVQFQNASYATASAPSVASPSVASPPVAAPAVAPAASTSAPIAPAARPSAPARPAGGGGEGL
jgi:outer membrane protein OmpA-like peptidoglycan-associated protein